MADAFENCEPRTLSRVLTAAIFSTIEKHLFDSTTACAEVTSNFSITVAQLHKAITGVNYKSGPHAYKKKKCTTTETVTTTSVVKKPAEDTTMSAVEKPAEDTTTSAVEKPAEDTLSSSSDSEPLYNPF